MNFHSQHVAGSPALPNLTTGLWRLCDPKISLASITSMFLGSCAAAAAGPIDLFWLALTVIGILALEAAKNASGDVYDFDSGADPGVADEDRSPFSGGKRVIVDGLMTRKETIFTAAALYLLGILIGLIIVFVREPAILLIGFFGVLLAFFYHAPPLKLSYRGFGELAVATVYGPLICCGTYLVQRGELPVTIILLSLPLGLLIAAFLVINEFPDRKADRKANKKNLVVRLGSRGAGQLLTALILLAYLGIALLPFAELPTSVWIGLLGMPFGVRAASRALSTAQTAAIIPAQRWLLISFCLAALGSGFGMLL